MMDASMDHLVELVRAHGGLDRDAARAALDDAVGQIMAGLSAEGRQALIADLPALAAARPPQRAVDLSDPRARERVAAACLALASELPEPALEAARSAAPMLSSWLTPPSPAAAPPPHGPRPPSTLSNGRPGSRHPLSEGSADRAHTHSLARSDDPHGDTKLSGGRPGSRRPISGR